MTSLVHYNALLFLLSPVPLISPKLHSGSTMGSTLTFMTGSGSSCSLLMKARRFTSSKLLIIWQLTTRLEEYCLNLSIKPGMPQHYLLLFSIILTLQRQLESDAYVNDICRVRPKKYSYQYLRLRFPVTACNWVIIFSWN